MLPALLEKWTASTSAQKHRAVVCIAFQDSWAPLRCVLRHVLSPAAAFVLCCAMRILLIALLRRLEKISILITDFIHSFDMVGRVMKNGTILACWPARIVPTAVLRYSSLEALYCEFSVFWEFQNGAICISDVANTDTDGIS